MTAKVKINKHCKGFSAVRPYVKYIVLTYRPYSRQQSNDLGSLNSQQNLAINQHRLDW